MVKLTFINYLKLLTSSSTLAGVQNEIAASKSDVILKANAAIFAKMDKLTNKTNKKLEKANAKLEAAKAGVEAANANTVAIEANKAKSEQLVAKYTEARKNKLAADANSTPWAQYQDDYNYAEKILEAKAIATKIQDNAQAKVTAAQKKIGVAQYMGGYNKLQAVKANKLLLDYYNDIYGTYDDIINTRIENTYDIKAAPLHEKVAKKNAKLVALNEKIAKIEANTQISAEEKTAKINKINDKISKAKFAIEACNIKINKIETVKSLITAQFSK